MSAPEPFVPPPYPYDRLADVAGAACSAFGTAIDLSVGTPGDPPPTEVLDALAAPDAARTYPPSVGTPAYREACAAWMERRLGVAVPPAQVAACVGTKELVTSLPHVLRLRRPDLDTVLYPAVSYPSYAMGAQLAGCRAVAVPTDESWRSDLDRIDPADAARALCLWVNVPGNPAGNLDDLSAAAEWGRRNGVVVASDECYVEFTWSGPRRTVLDAGTEGLLAVHSLSKRSNLAGGRAGFYAGDAALVHYLAEVRKHQGLLVPGPVQRAGVIAWGDDHHVDVQAERYRRRLGRLRAVLAAVGLDAPMPGGAFYLWARAPGGDAWSEARRLAERLGIVVSPGEFYGDAGRDHVRVAAVLSDSDLAALEQRAGLA